jgi:hypothetical protein
MGLDFSKIKYHNKGDEFRDQVCALLRAAGFNVATEVRLGHKKVDAVAEKNEYGRIKRYGIECKNYESSLTKEQSIKLIVDYLPLRQDKLVNEVWIIAKTFSADARHHIDALEGFRAFEFAELKYVFADFSAYLSSLTKLYDEQQIEAYYIRPLTPDGDDLETVVLEWLDRDNVPPIAIEAGYGKGKTTFSLHICNRLARSTSDIRCRIPVYVPLGEITAEQPVSGLISDVLARFPFVSNYSFELIRILNEEGCFIFILDGFDEMKHGLSTEQFRYNFEQLLQLHGPRSKIIILGRPTGFLSEDERNLVLLGYEKTHSGQTVRDGTWPKFNIMDIADWRLEDAHRYIKNYYVVACRKYSAQLTGEQIEERLKALLGGNYDSLIVRPVHAKMLVDIATEPEALLKTLNTFQLYDRFVHALVRRELTKGGRDRNISISTRRQFAGEIAWWMWKEAGLQGVRADEIPDAIVSKFRYVGKDYGLAELRRELICGCCVDKRDGAAIYFPHLSFQEFLVAEYLVQSRSFYFAFGSSVASISPLIGQFLLECADPRLASDIIQGLANHVGAVDWQVLKLIARLCKGQVALSREDIIRNAWLMYVHLFQIGNFGEDEVNVAPVNMLLGQFAEEKIDNVNKWAILALLQLSCWASQFADENLKETMLRDICLLILKTCPIKDIIRNVKNLKRGEQLVITPHDYDGPIPYVLVSGSFRIEVDDGPVKLKFLPRQFLATVESLTKNINGVLNVPVLPDISEQFDLQELLALSDGALDIEAWRLFFADGEVRRKIDTMN